MHGVMGPLSPLGYGLGGATYSNAVGPGLRPTHTRAILTTGTGGVGKTQNMRGRNPADPLHYHSMFYFLDGSCFFGTRYLHVKHTHT